MTAARYWSARTIQDGRMRVAVRLTADKAGQAMARFGAAMRPADTRKAAAE